MNITIQYFADCPNWQVAGERLQAALESEGISEPIEYVKVETDEEAERLQFHGSPTILVDGRDLFDAPGLATGLACRVYRTPTGLAGLPTVEQLTAAVHALVA